MRLRTSFFEFTALKQSIRRYAPLWVLYWLVSDPADVQKQKINIFEDLGGKNYAEILLS